MKRPRVLTREATSTRRAFLGSGKSDGRHRRAQPHPSHTKPGCG